MIVCTKPTRGMIQNMSQEVRVMEVWKTGWGRGEGGVRKLLVILRAAWDSKQKADQQSNERHTMRQKRARRPIQMQPLASTIRGVSRVPVTCVYTANLMQYDA
jgi:hypothetical protein